MNIRIVDFYKKAFGFEVKLLVPGKDDTTWHAELKYKDQILNVGKQGVTEGGASFKSPLSSGIESPISMYIYCENVDDFYKHAISQGAEAVTPPQDMPWGDRMCRLRDPEHYMWGFATNIAG